jgi:hypothetical protein
MLQTIEELPKFKGHLYNWYDIKNLLPCALSIFQLLTAATS